MAVNCQISNFGHCHEEPCKLNSDIFSEARDYIISRFNSNTNLKLYLAQFIVNTSNSFKILEETSTDNLFSYILCRVTELIDLMLVKSNSNLCYLKLLIDFLSIDVIKLNEIVQMPNDLNGLQIYLSGYVMNMYRIEQDRNNNSGENYRNSRLDTSSMLSFSKSWKYLSKNNTTINHSNLSNSSTKWRRRHFFQYFQKLILCCFYCKK